MDWELISNCTLYSTIQSLQDFQPNECSTPPFSNINSQSTCVIVTLSPNYNNIKGNCLMYIIFLWVQFISVIWKCVHCCNRKSMILTHVVHDYLMVAEKLKVDGNHNHYLSCLIQVTIPLMDIALECLSTSSGYHHQRYVLVAAQTAKPSARWEIFIESVPYSNASFTRLVLIHT